MPAYPATTYLKILQSLQGMTTWCTLPDEQPPPPEQGDAGPQKPAVCLFHWKKKKKKKETRKASRFYRRYHTVKEVQNMTDALITTIQGKAL